MFTSIQKVHLEPAVTQHVLSFTVIRRDRGLLWIALKGGIKKKMFLYILKCKIFH